MNMKSKDGVIIPDGFHWADFTDVEFSRWLKRNGWTGNSHPDKDCVFFTAKKGVLAIVVFKNDPPVDRKIYTNRRL